MITEHVTHFTVYPEMCNHFHTEENKPMIHGGYLTMQMDRCAADLARLALFSSVYMPVGQKQLKYRADYAVTVGIENIRFNFGASQGDLLRLNAVVDRLGNRRISIVVTVLRIRENGSRLMASGLFHFCAMSSETGKSHSHGLRLE